MIRRSFLGLLGGLPLISAAGCATLSDPRSRTLLEGLETDGAPGVAVAAIQAGRTLALGGKGALDRDPALAPGPDTVFEIGSLTKTFTACLVFELADEGGLAIEAPIGTYVPDLPEAWRPLRLDQLLSHTSGLPNYINADNFFELMPRDLAPRDLVAMAADKPFVFAPGERHEYNNTGFVLLGMAAEAVTGRVYWDELEQRFFRPAGMRSTGPRGRVRPGADAASGHFWNGEHWDEHPPFSAPGSTWSAGGLLSTARDLSRWAVALDQNRIVNARVRERMWRPATLANGQPAGWGYGWQVETVDGRRVVSHGGGTAGFSCWLRRETETPLTTVVLTNQNGRADPLTITGRLLAALATDGMIRG